MPESRDVIADQLRNAARNRCPVRVERVHEWWAADVNGFVVSVGERWVAIQRLMDSVYADGYEVVRIEDVTQVEEDRENGYVERAVADLGRPKVDFRLPEDAATGDVLRAAADHATLVCVHLEREDDSPLLIGHIDRLGERKFDIQLINPRGVWTVDPTRWWYKEVTRVRFGDRYSAALERFGDERPVD